MIRGLDRVVRGLGSNEQALQDLVTNFRVFSGSFAAEDEALGRLDSSCFPTSCARPSPRSRT